MNQIRVQILLGPRQHTALKKAARQAKVSMSELIRQITDEYLARITPDQEDEVLQALNNLKGIREKRAPTRENRSPKYIRNASANRPETNP